MSSRKICNFHNKPGGCRNGQDCRFAHIDSPGAAASTSSNPSSPVRWQQGGKIPFGVCKFFLEGNCNRGASCNYRHEANPNDAPGLASAAGLSRPFVTGFLTEAGPAKVLEAGSDVFFHSPSSEQLRTPTQVHAALYRVLADDYRFHGTVQMYSFVGLLTNANSSNPAWSLEEGQLLLNKVTTANGLNRICDIIRFDPVSLTAGSNRDRLSFQRGYIPVLQYLSSEFVVKSTLSHSVNALYTTVMNNFSYFANVIESSMDEAMKKRSFKDFGMFISTDLSANSVLNALTEVLFECITRFKNTVATHPELPKLIYHVSEWMDTWIAGINSNPSTFADPFKNMPSQSREYFLTHLKSKVTRIVAIAERELSRLDRATRPQEDLTAGFPQDGIINALELTYHGPGIQRDEGPRHDNDHVDFADIRIAPTHQELICRIPPFLPANLHGAPHPLPAGSMERLLDIQYRLLREELTAPIRSSIQLVFDDLLSRGSTQLSQLLDKCGGRYRHKNAVFNVYTNVKFTTLVPGWRGISAQLIFDTPPGSARVPQAHARTSFWEMGKRFLQGGLIALAWKSGTDVTVHLGVLASSQKDIVASAQEQAEWIAANVVFFDPAVEIRILQSLKRSEPNVQETRVLIEAPVMFESIRPFLEALQVAEPESIPFPRYLVHQSVESLQNTIISPPAYATVPGFSFQLSYLFPESAGIDDLKMVVGDPASIDNARQQLRASSRLDPSQVDAVVSALTRELALIQGPPGTGKSYTGIELLRVLIKNGVRPILMIALTNHALDHLLSASLDANITSSIVRLGSRSADERISQYNLEEIEKDAVRSRLDSAFADKYRDLKCAEEQIMELMESFLKKHIASQDIINYLQDNYPDLYEWLFNPPPWIASLYKIGMNDGDSESWETVGPRSRAQEADTSFYTFWKNGTDLAFLCLPATPARPPAEHKPFPESNARSQNQFDVLATTSDEPSSSDDDDGSDSEDSHGGDVSSLEGIWSTLLEESRPQSSQDDFVAPVPNPTRVREPPKHLGIEDLQDPNIFLAHFGHETLPAIPTSNRSLHQLLEQQPDLWHLSREERTRLHDYFIKELPLYLHETQLEEYNRLRELHADALERYNEGKNEIRRQLLANVDIIGATTTGAAKLTSLLSSIGPRAMLVEEAGQVLETHILGTLTRAVQHCILIGDPLQLRPTLNNYELSMDNHRGRTLYKFDMSLMERLSSGGFPMSRLDVQRRMRPSIAHLVRSTLYPTLEDHSLVRSYPAVRGFAKNVFFFTHNHRECDGGEQSSSKYNTFEVDMIKELVLYLLRQGSYNQDGDIVVLCGYLGQLARVRDALASEVVVLIDERDQAGLANAGDDDNGPAVNPTIEHVKVSRRVR